jgi:hypothetical protein
MLVTDHVYSMTIKDNITIKEQITDTICEEWRIWRKTQSKGNTQRENSQTSSKYKEQNIKINTEQGKHTKRKMTNKY